jgi:prepilin-type N-terminal cleavage/methylation domain-containing protein
MAGNVRYLIMRAAVPQVMPQTPLQVARNPLHGHATHGSMASARRRGFTLIELLATITLAGLILGISMSRISAISSHQRVGRAVASMQSYVQAAFSLAVRNGHPVRLTWKPDLVEFQITNRAGDTTYRTIQFGTDPYGFTASNVTVSTSPLEIFPNGLASDTLRVSITADGSTRALRVSRAGLAQIQ